jgi:GR25 family glycosyltransferase involved in LPS biosynthesis
MRLDDIGLEHEVVPAVFPPAERPWSPHYDEVRRVNTYGYPMVRGEVGCFLAHRDAWRRAAEGETDVTLILEDDAVVPGSDLASIRQVASAPEIKGAATLLFTVSRLRFRRWLHLGNVSVVRPTDMAYSTAAYLVGKEGAAKLLADSEAFWCPVDEFLNLEYLHGVTLVHTSPFLAGNLEEMASLIGPRTKPKLSNFRRMRRNWHRLIRRLRDGACRLRTLTKMGLLFTKIEQPASTS